MKLKITNPIVSVQWLQANLYAENLIVLDATIQKVGVKENLIKEKQHLKNAVFFDLKTVFLDVNGKYPNTIPSQEHFESEVQKLGVNKDTCIVVYDDIGTYSSPRVWWLFKVFGFTNIAVLNGGLPAWKNAGFFTEKGIHQQVPKGNFTASFQKDLFADTAQVLKASTEKATILDARSKARFFAETPEPRKGLRGGHIPNSTNLPYANLQVGGIMKEANELTEIIFKHHLKQDNIICSCGSGITACIIALAIEITGNTNYSIYDGSWTEWASRLELPVEK